MRIKLLYLYSYNSHNKWMLHTFISFKTERGKEVKPLWEKTKSLLLYSNEKKELQTYRSAPQIYKKLQEMTKEKCPSTQRWEASLPSFVAPRGIEPLFQGWKPCVLTDRRKGHQSHDCYYKEEESCRAIYSLSPLFWITPSRSRDLFSPFRADAILLKGY